MGLMNGRSAEDEAVQVNKKLEAAGVIISNPFEYISKANCIVGQVKHGAPEAFLGLLTYDCIYYRINGGSYLYVFSYQ